MAKKPIGEPKVPPGPQHQFFDHLQRLVRRYGDLSLEAIVVRGLYCSPQVLHRALVGPKLPSRRLVQALVNVLGCMDEDKGVALKLFELAQEDQIQRSRNSPIGMVKPSAGAWEELQKRISEPYAAAGSPSIRRIAQEVARLYPQRALTPSTLHSWLTGATLPRRFEDLMAFVGAIENIAYERGDLDPMTVETPPSLRPLWEAAQRERAAIAQSRRQ